MRSQIRPCGTRSRCLSHCHNSPHLCRGSRCWLWDCAQEVHRGACFGCCSDWDSSFPLWGPHARPLCQPSHLYPCVQVCSLGKWCLPRVLVSDPGCLCSSCPRRPLAAHGAAAHRAEIPSACQKVPDTVWYSSRLWRCGAAAWSRPHRGSRGVLEIKLHPQPHQQ